MTWCSVSTWIDEGSAGDIEAWVIRFTSTYINKVDKKGRVSVPAPFRDMLMRDGGAEALFRPHPTDPAINGYSQSWLDAVQELIETLPPDSAEREMLEEREFSTLRPITHDGEGRMILSKDMMERAGITDQAKFVGKGRYFQIWEPARHDAHHQRMMELSAGLSLPSAGPR